MKSIISIATLVLALAAAPLLAQQASNAGNVPAQQPAAQTAPSVQTDAASTEPEPGEEVVCRRDRATGSLTRVNRICKTRNEWNGVRDANREDMNDLQRNASRGALCNSVSNC